MDRNDVVEFLHHNHHAIFVTTRRDGSPQLSPVAVGVDDGGTLLVSTRSNSAKAVNARRTEKVSLCIISDAFFGPWMQVDGTCAVIDLPDAMDGLIDYYRRVGGEHNDWDEYRDAMVREGRVLLRIGIDRVGPANAH